MEFKDRLKELRENAGLSMASLAKIAGVTKAAIGNYESGIRVPRKEQLEAFADIFNVDLDYLTFCIIMNPYFMRVSEHFC